MPLPLLERIVYGPVRSRRLGASLGINLLPPGMKVCNLNCAYCQYGWTRGATRYRGQGAGWPSVQAIVAAVRARLQIAASRNEMIDRLTVAGHGEPTLRPGFEEITSRLCDVRDRIAPRLPMVVLSNSSTAARPDVKRALSQFDERHMKLDAGDPFSCARINGSGTSVTTIVDALGSLPPVVIQAMFVTDRAGEIDNCNEGSVTEWLSAVESVHAKRVHVYTLDRPPALDTLRPVGTRRLREIAERVRAAGVPTDVFPATVSRHAAR